MGSGELDDGFNANDVTTVAKKVIRQLRVVPIVLAPLLGEWVELSKEGTVVPTTTAISNIIEQHVGCTVEGDMLRALCTHLHEVTEHTDVNLATANNLARISHFLEEELICEELS